MWGHTTGNYAGAYRTKIQRSYPESQGWHKVGLGIDRPREATIAAHDSGATLRVDAGFLIAIHLRAVQFRLAALVAPYTQDGQHRVAVMARAPESWGRWEPPLYKRALKPQPDRPQRVLKSPRIRPTVNLDRICEQQSKIWSGIGRRSLV